MQAWSIVCDLSQSCACAPWSSSAEDLPNKSRASGQQRTDPPPTPPASMHFPNKFPRNKKSTRFCPETCCFYPAFGLSQQQRPTSPPAHCCTSSFPPRHPPMHCCTSCCCQRSPGLGSGDVLSMLTMAGEHLQVFSCI